MLAQHHSHNRNSLVIATLSNIFLQDEHAATSATGAGCHALLAQLRRAVKARSSGAQLRRAAPRATSHPRTHHWPLRPLALGPFTTVHAKALVARTWLRPRGPRCFLLCLSPYPSPPPHPLPLLLAPSPLPLFSAPLLPSPLLCSPLLCSPLPNGPSIAPCPMPHSRCPMPHPPCPISHPSCSMPHLPSRMPHLPSLMFYAPSPIPHAPSPIPHAQRSIAPCRTGHPVRLPAGGSTRRGRSALACHTPSPLAS
ncbi:unnamed protein product [Closterium sp. NIES-53]